METKTLTVIYNGSKTGWGEFTNYEFTSLDGKTEYGWYTTSCAKWLPFNYGETVTITAQVSKIERNVMELKRVRKTK